jgi:beta-galactosidase/beta-glucuronidase
MTNSTNDSATTNIPRPEYPRPQCVRSEWRNLNGTWEFEIDNGDSGLARGLKDRPLMTTITVPFCPESELSGVGNTDFMAAVWYRREIGIPDTWGGQRVLLHFQASDYDTTVWANGVEVGRHRGGMSGFSCDLSGIAKAGKSVTVVVRARDNTREMGPRGKQSQQHENHACFYIRTTGIWQTVWMEPVPQTYLLRPRITPDVTNGMLIIEQRLGGSHENKPGYTVCVSLKIGEKVIAQAEIRATDFAPRLYLAIPKEHIKLWSIEDPFLYDLKIELLDPEGTVCDIIHSYAGLRSVTIDGMAIKINGETVFQRLVLDQGYYPDGILTAPTDEALIRDIELSIAAGFNGARLHQKVFEERFLYHCDRLGYIVHGEFSDWGCNDGGAPDNHQQPTASYITEWLEILERDYNHPAIVAWCPLNETYQVPSDVVRQLDIVTRGMFLATKAMDGTRPVLDTSGYAHRVIESDIYDSHDYDQNPETFKAHHDGLLEGKPYINDGWNGKPTNIPYNGQPYFVSEFGGIWWNPKAKEGEDSWGYGDRPTSLEAFYTRFEGLCMALLQNPMMFGYCYTQLTDVYQEQNGIYGFDRSEKFDMAKIHAVQTQKAAIEG